MLYRDSIPLQITVAGRLLTGYARPMFENGSFGDYACTFQIYFSNYYMGYMFYYEDRGWVWAPQNEGKLPGAGDQIAAIIVAWYG
jgi:hypothetical protein